MRFKCPVCGQLRESECIWMHTLMTCKNCKPEPRTPQDKAVIEAAFECVDRYLTRIGSGNYHACEMDFIMAARQHPDYKGGK